MIVIIFLVLFFIVFGLYCCIKVGAEADRHGQMIREMNGSIISKCSKCNKHFAWSLEDAIIKKNYNEYTVPCPHCGKLIKITRDSG